MAMSGLRQMVIEGDRPAPAVAQPGMTKLPDGSLIMRGTPKAAIEQPGMLSGLMNWAKSKLSPAQAQPEPYWLQQPAPVAGPVGAPVTAPAAAVAGPGVPLPAYNDPWGEIEAKAADQERVKRELGTVSSNIMNSPAIIEGKWGGGR